MNNFHLITIIILLAVVITITGCRISVELQDRAEVVLNIQYLHNADPETRLMAVKYLSKRVDYDELVIPALIDALQDENSIVRLEALRALSSGHMTPELEDVLPDIIVILENPDETDDMRCSASRLLAYIGFDANDVDSEVIDLLIKQLQDENWLVRESAIVALTNITSVERAIEPLIERLDDEHLGVQGAAAIALGTIGQNAQEALPKIIEMLENEEYATRRFATWALGAYGPWAHEAIPHVIRALKEGLIAPDEAGTTLGRIAKDRETTEMLMSWLANEDEELLRRAACQALGYLVSSSGVVDALLNTLQNDVNPEVRSCAVVSLGKTEPSYEIIEALIAALDDEDSNVAEMAEVSLGNLAKTAAENPEAQRS